MKKEYKFRGRRNEKSEWLYFDMDDYFLRNQEMPIFLQYNLIDVCQFIGLKDKNGVDIYERDIVMYSDKYIDKTLCLVPDLKDCFLTNEIGYELQNRSNSFCEVFGFE